MFVAQADREQSQSGRHTDPGGAGHRNLEGQVDEQGDGGSAEHAVDRDDHASHGEQEYQRP